MRVILSLSILIALLITVPGCKRNQWKDLEYSSVTANDIVQANVNKIGGDGVLWFQVFDQVEDKTSVDSYKNAEKKIEGNPVKVFENKWIWMLVNNRIEIRLIADDKSKEFTNTEKLTKFILSFDLKGMKKVTGPKLKGEDLKKFIPSLGKK